MLSLEHVTFTYGQGKPDLKEISIHVPRGYITALVGKNGAGKTTLLKVLYGALTQNEGKRICDGKEIRESKLEEFHDKCAYVGTEEWEVAEQSMYWHLDLFERLYSRFDRRIALAILDQFKLPEEARKQKITALSTGQRMQLQMALALAKQPDYLILDEPLANIDPVIKVDMLTLLQRAVADGCGVIISTHLMHEIEGIADRIVWIEEGCSGIDKENELLLEEEQEESERGIHRDDNNDSAAVEDAALYHFMANYAHVNVIWVVTLITAAVTMLFQVRIGTGLWLSLMEIFLLFAVSYAYLSKYTNVRVRNGSIFEEQSLEKRLRFHRFPAAEHLRILMRKFLPIWIGYMLMIFLCMVVCFSPIRLLYLLIWVFAPGLIFQIRKHRIFRELSCEESFVEKIVRTIAYGAYNFTLYASAVTMLISLVSELNAYTANRLFYSFTWTKAQPACMGSPYSWMTILDVVAAASLLIIMLHKEEMLEVYGRFHIKVIRLRAALGLLTATTIVLGLYICSMNYRIWGQKQFVMSAWGEEKSYQLEDITACRIYLDGDTFMMDVNFSDGTVMQTCGDDYGSENDLRGEVYSSDFAYARALAESLLEEDVVPTLEDADEIREMMEGYEKEAVRDFEALAVLLAGTK